MEVRRLEVFLVSLDPTVGGEIRKSRPCVVVSPDEANRHLKTVVIAPMTSRARPYPSRVSVRFDGVDGQVAIDQVRAVDRSRLVRSLGRLDPNAGHSVLRVLSEFFAA